MNFFMKKGQPFAEYFDFKNARGESIALPAGSFRVVLERGGFAKEYTYGNGLDRLANRINWRIPASETESFVYSTMYYTLYLEDTEITRGVLKIQ